MTYRLFRSHRDKMSVTNATMKHTLLGIIKIYLVANFLFFCIGGKLTFKKNFSRATFLDLILVFLSLPLNRYLPTEVFTNMENISSKSTMKPIEQCEKYIQI